jgi:hypothetical protein
MYPAMPDGLAGLPSDPPLIYADGTALAVKVRANRGAWLRGLRLETGDTEQSIALTSNATAGTIRKDLFVWRMTRNPWDASIVRIPGTPLVSPTVPSPVYGADTSTGVWDLPLAVATINAGDEVTTLAKVTPLAWYVGEDGQILCTDTTRPPHHLGRTAYETNTKRWILSDGTDWTRVLDDSGVTAMTREAGWTATRNEVRRRNGWVRAVITASRSTAIAADSTVKALQLPAGCYPSSTEEGVLRHDSSAGLTVGLRVTPTGGVYVITPQGVGVNPGRTLTGSITFPVA